MVKRWVDWCRQQHRDASRVLKDDLICRRAIAVDNDPYENRLWAQTTTVLYNDDPIYRRRIKPRLCSQNNLVKGPTFLDLRMKDPWRSRGLFLTHLDRVAHALPFGLLRPSSRDYALLPIRRHHGRLATAVTGAGRANRSACCSTCDRLCKRPRHAGYAIVIVPELRRRA